MSDALAALQRVKQSARTSADVAAALSQIRPQTTKEYFHAIGAFAKVRDWRGALALLDEMHERRVQPDMYCYSAALTALDKARQPKRALALFDEMRRDGVAANVFTFTATISACAKGDAREARRGLALLDEMKAAGVEPNAITYNAAIAACGDNWETALRLIDEMETHRLRPTRVSYSSVAQRSRASAAVIASVHLSAPQRTWVGLRRRGGSVGIPSRGV
jgi:pentatricopeptide repeat protein